MRPTHETAESWRGRDVLDTDGERLGVLAGVAGSRDEVRPSWLAVELIEAASEVVLAPADGAEETGGAVRLAALAATVRSAPPAPARRELLPADDVVLLAHYRGAKPAGAAPPEPPADSGPPQPLDPVARRALVARLRQAHALESEALLRLGVLTSVVTDAEVEHDATLYRGQGELHRTGIEARLTALDAAPSRRAEGLRAARAAASGVRERLRGDSPAVLRDAIAFERREAAFYAALEDLARGHGDTATLSLATALRADEEAMACTLEGSVTRLESPA